MALLEYDIQYNKKKHTGKVTLKVRAVEKGDRISYKSNSPETAIQYRRGSPFSGNEEPKTGSHFRVGKKQGPFKVTETIPETGTDLHFDCGEIEKTVKKVKGRSVTVEKFKRWKGAGDGTPPGD